MESTKQTSVRFPASIHTALRMRLLKEGKSLSEWAREMAEAYLRG